MPHNIVTERSELWPCSPEARRLVEDAMSAAFNYGELPNYKTQDTHTMNDRYKTYQEAQSRLVQYVAGVERQADIPGVWMHEQNAPLSAEQATERRARKAKVAPKVARAKSGNRSRNGAARKPKR